jgi:F1F0 ATPase subunit 2
MSETLASLVALPAGAALGAIYFAGLWWTTRHAVSFRRPALCILVSALLRMGIALGGFYGVAGGDWLRMLLCLTGFMAARVAMTRLTRLPTPEPGNDAAGLHHAP